MRPPPPPLRCHPSHAPTFASPPLPKRHGPCHLFSARASRCLRLTVPTHSVSLSPNQARHPVFPSILFIPYQSIGFWFTGSSRHRLLPRSLPTRHQPPPFRPWLALLQFLPSRAYPVLPLPSPTFGSRCRLLQVAATMNLASRPSAHVAGPPWFNPASTDCLGEPLPSPWCLCFPYSHPSPTRAPRLLGPKYTNMYSLCILH